MDGRVLVKQFHEDPGATFVELIREADRPVRLKDLREVLVDAGVPTADVDRQWKRLRISIQSHPRISKPDLANYEWSPIAHPSKESFQGLLAKVSSRTPAWLIQAYTDNVMDSLAKAETTGSRAQTGWTEQREREKATLMAHLVGTAEVLATDGRSASEIVEWLLSEAGRIRLTAIGRIGERQNFDRDQHDPVDERRLRPGQEVRVVRPGYIWDGGGRPVVIAKALIE